MRILGIDIGSTSVKAVELETAFGRFEIRDYHEQKLGLEVSQSDAIKLLLSSLTKQPDRIAVAMPTRFSTFRNLKLPSKDKKVIQSTVLFELEDDLPFAIEDTVTDHVIIGKSKQGSNVHVAATLQNHYDFFLKSLKDSGIDPDLITTEAWSLRTLINRMYPEGGAQTPKDQPQIVVILGNERTLVYGHWRGAPLFCREVAWGGKELTLAIGRKYELTLPEAEKTKIDHAFLLPPSQIEKATAEQLEFSDSLLEAIEPLIYELRQASLMCKNLSGKTAAHILLGGGSAQLPGLARFLIENLRTPVLTLRGLSQVVNASVTYSEHTDHHFSAALSAALCLVGNDRGHGINFRKGPRAKRSQTQAIQIQNLRAPLTATGAVLLTLILTLVIEAKYYSARMVDTDGQLERAVKGFFVGGLSNAAVQKYIATPNELRSTISKDLVKQRELNQLYGANPQSPLNFLKHLSSSVPRDIVTDLIEFRVGAAPGTPYSVTSENQSTMTFVFANAQTADRLATILGSKLDAVNKTKLEEVPDPAGGPARWKVTFTGRPLEVTYGK